MSPLATSAQTPATPQLVLGLGHMMLIALALALGIAYAWNKRRHNQRLQQLVLERTQTLHEQAETMRRQEQELAKSQKMSAIGQLTGGIAHDFNNLLTVINGALELLQEGRKDRFRSGDQALISDALAAAQSGADTTRQLLAYARKRDLHPEEFDVSEHVRKLAPLLTRALGPERHLTIQTPTQPVTAELDKGQLTTALLNLMINARDATLAGGSVTLAMSSQEVLPRHAGVLETGRYASINVLDDGSGMSSDELQKACEPFFSTKTPGAGSGLGLSMVYGFAKQSSGELIIASEPSRGTEMQLFVPLTDFAVDVAELN